MAFSGINFLSIFMKIALLIKSFRWVAYRRTQTEGRRWCKYGLATCLYFVIREFGRDDIMRVTSRVAIVKA